MTQITPEDRDIEDHRRLSRAAGELRIALLAIYPSKDLLAEISVQLPSEIFDRVVRLPALITTKIPADGDGVLLEGLRFSQRR